MLWNSLITILDQSCISIIIVEEYKDQKAVSKQIMTL